MGQPPFRGGAAKACTLLSLNTAQTATPEAKDAAPSMSRSVDFRQRGDQVPGKAMQLLDSA